MAQAESANNANKILMATLLGVSLGLLFAPKSGRKTRSDLSQTADELRQKGRRLTDKAKVKWGEFRSDIKAEKNEMKDQMAESVDDLAEETKDRLS